MSDIPDTTVITLSESIFAQGAKFCAKISGKDSWEAKQIYLYVVKYFLAFAAAFDINNGYYDIHSVFNDRKSG